VAIVAALLDSRSTILSLRRAIPRGGLTVTSCRGLGALARVLESRLVEAIITAPRLAGSPAVAQLFGRFPGIPRLLYAPFRPDDGENLESCCRSGVAVAVEGVDDAVLGEIIGRMSLSAERRRALGDAPRVLRLHEKLQRDVWDYLIVNVATPVRTDEVAQRFQVSREHLSRQFGAGGAPNLKRVIDLTRIACAAQLLGNPGYGSASVAKILGFASSSHLSDTAKRVAGVSARKLGMVGPRGVLGVFARGKTRSRE
jgi:AraC-like DNA-binding protein